MGYVFEVFDSIANLDWYEKKRERWYHSNENTPPAAQEIHVSRKVTQL